MFFVCGQTASATIESNYFVIHIRIRQVSLKILSKTIICSQCIILGSRIRFDQCDLSSDEKLKGNNHYARCLVGPKSGCVMTTDVLSAGGLFIQDNFQRRYTNLLILSIILVETEFRLRYIYQIRRRNCNILVLEIVPWANH